MKFLVLLGILLIATPAFAQLPGLSELERFGFADMLLWLLTFAIVYGVLSQIKMPASSSARMIIAIVSGFFVLLSAPAELISVLSKLSSSLILAVIGILAFVVFLEIARIRFHVKVKGKHPQTGEEVEGLKEVTFFEKHALLSAVVLIIIAGLIFIGSGGLGIIGFQNLPQINLTGIVFFIVIILAVVWMLAEAGKEK